MTTARTITLVLFVLLVLVTLGITIWASRRTHNATDFYAGGRSFTGFQNGMAIGGDYMSAATFLGMSSETAKIATIILIGILMIVYVVIGGMKGTTYVQIVKAFLLMMGAILLALLVAVAFKFNLSSLLGEAATKSGKGDLFLD